MSPARKESGAAERRAPEPDRDEEARPSARPPVFLRTVYPLNPGIPHFVDFPSGWRGRE